MAAGVKNTDNASQGLIDIIVLTSPAENVKHADKFDGLLYCQTTFVDYLL